MTALLALAGVAVLAWWIVARARLGVRVRAIGGARPRVRALVALIASRAAARRALVVALAAGAFVGAGAALPGGVAALAVEPLIRRRAAAAERTLLDAQVPAAARTIAAALRAGLNLPLALAAARDAAAVPLRTRLVRLVGLVDAGASVPEAVRALDGRSEALAGLAEALRVGHRAGATLPDVLDALVESLADRARVAAERRAATAQARLSGAIVASMPLVFVLLAGASGRAHLAMLAREPAGLLVLGAGATLEIAGLLWMRALLRPR